MCSTEVYKMEACAIKFSSQNGGEDMRSIDVPDDHMMKSKRGNIYSQTHYYSNFIFASEKLIGFFNPSCPERASQ